MYSTSSTIATSVCDWFQGDADAGADDEDVEAELQTLSEVIDQALCVPVASLQLTRKTLYHSFKSNLSFALDMP